MSELEMVQLHFRNPSTEPARQGGPVLISIADIVLVREGSEANRAREAYTIGTDILLRHIGMTPVQVYEDYDFVLEILVAASLGMSLEQWRAEQEDRARHAAD